MLLLLWLWLLGGKKKLLFWLTGKTVLLTQHVQSSPCLGKGIFLFSLPLLPRPLPHYNHFYKWFGLKEEWKDEPAFSGGRGQMAATIKGRGHLVPVGKCRKELCNPVGTDNSLTNERCNEHFIGQHKAQIKPGCESASVEVGSCRDARRQAGITLMLSRSSGLIFKQNKGPATEQAKATLAGETLGLLPC